MRNIICAFLCGSDFFVFATFVCVLEKNIAIRFVFIYVCVSEEDRGDFLCVL